MPSQPPALGSASDGSELPDPSRPRARLWFLPRWHSLVLAITVGALCGAFFEPRNQVASGVALAVIAALLCFGPAFHCMTDATRSFAAQVPGSGRSRREGCTCPSEQVDAHAGWFELDALCRQHAPLVVTDRTELGPPEPFRTQRDRHEVFGGLEGDSAPALCVDHGHGDCAGDGDA